MLSVCTCVHTRVLHGHAALIISLSTPKMSIHLFLYCQGELSISADPVMVGIFFHQLILIIYHLIDQRTLNFCVYFKVSFMQMCAG